MSPDLPSDDVLVVTYIRVGYLADAITQSSALWKRFLKALPEAYQGLDIEAIAKRLVHPRNRGKLPKLFRRQHSNSQVAT